MWILQFLPEWVFHVILLVGLAGLGASFVLKFIPFVTQYRVPIQVLAGILIVFSVYMEGAISNQTSWKLKVAAAEKRALESEARAAAANAKIEYVYVDKIKKVMETKYVVRERIKVVEKKIDVECKVTPEAVNILNYAALNKKPGEKK